MRPLRFLIALALPGTLAAQGVIDTTTHAIGLDEAVSLAQKNAPATVQSRGEVRASHEQVRGSYAAFIPSVSLNAGASRQGGDRFDPSGQLVPFTGNSWQYNHGLTLNLDLFNGGQRLFSLRANRASENAAVANDVEQRFQVALQVKQQYYAVLAAREAESAAESQLSEAEEQLKTSIANLRARMVTRSDSLRSVIAVGNAQLAILTAKNDVTAANAALTRLVATPFTVTALPEDTLQQAIAPVDSATLAQLALNGPLVQQAQASQQAAHASAKAARAPYLPTLTASFSLTGSGSNDAFTAFADKYAYQNNLRFGLSYPIFNQLQREQGIVNADVAAQNADAQLRDAKLGAQQTFVQALAALRTAQQQVDIQTLSVAAAEEDLRVQKQRYNLSASTILDVLTSETALVQARAALIQARYNARVAKAQLEALIGRDL